MRKYPSAFLTFDTFFKQFPSKFFKKRAPILLSGVTPEDIYYLKLGYARTYAVSMGGEELTMVIFQPGDFFPLISTIKAERLEYYIESMTDVEIISVPRYKFLDFLRSRPDLMDELIMRLTARFEGALSRMEYLAFGTAAQRLSSIMIILGERFGRKVGSKIIIQSPLTHRDLASLVGITRETATLILGELNHKGFIEFKKRHLIIKNLRGLQKYSLL